MKPRTIAASVTSTMKFGLPMFIFSMPRVLEHARQHLAHFKVPKRVVVAEALPRNPSGKILKRQLRQEHVGAFG
jgi:acyl-CoA synthetase (AMP-forming)/AMP-acid ligase II